MLCRGGLSSLESAKGKQAFAFATVCDESGPGELAMADVTRAQEVAASALDPESALPGSFYARDPVTVARDLLGCTLVSDRPEGVTAGIIVETEAYGDQDDPASHASFRRSGAVRAMWGPDGMVYVYRAYGVYPCFNIVTGPEGVPAAVLIRALEPVTGLDLMARRCRTELNRRIASGPGRLSIAMGICLADNEWHLDCPPLWVQSGRAISEIVTGTRIGVRRGVEQPWRFGVAGHPALSRPFRE
jgi:DNA-3-methyladenine glycosylase